MTPEWTLIFLKGNFEAGIFLSASVTNMGFYPVPSPQRLSRSNWNLRRRMCCKRRVLPMKAPRETKPHTSRGFTQQTFSESFSGTSPIAAL